MKRNTFTCNCDAYNFPHRILGGKCTAINIVESGWKTSACEHCNLRSRSGCDVLRGVERTTECQILIDFLEFNEVKI